MKKIKTLLLVALLALVTPAMADSYGYLTVATNGGAAAYELADVNRITFDNTNMILWNGDKQTATLPLATLDKMFFSETSGIAAITSDSKITLKDGLLSVSAPKGSRITLYNMKGQAIKDITASAEITEINLSGVLSNGVYIVKVGNHAKKLMNK